MIDRQGPVTGSMSPEPFDLAVIGGGVNGCGVARDAVGRGLSVVLCEQSDLGQATSSASTKLFHGGLRYLEHYKFRLVRESLIEREVLLRAMPHISWPLRFVLPHHKGLRPAWLLRLGLFIYDHLGGRRILPGTKTLDLRASPYGAPLRPEFTRAFEYSDCWVEDSRLVVLNARDAADRGAHILTRTQCESAWRSGDGWILALRNGVTGRQRTIHARTLVNAAGPWAGSVLRQQVGANTSEAVRLVRGSHIVTRRLFDHDRVYIFQNGDGRIFFAIPYETDFTLIGTTDVDHDGAPGDAVCTREEADYLCAAISEYLTDPVSVDDIVWSYAGVRPLYDDGVSSASKATRDYVLTLDDRQGAAPPLLNIFGGKITTYRRLAEAVLSRLRPYFPKAGGAWTAMAPLPGGDFPVDGVQALVNDLKTEYPYLDRNWALRLVRAYGTDAARILSGAKTRDGLGQIFGATLSAREVVWLMDREWAHNAEDVLWRRSKLGLRFSADETARLDRFMEARRNTINT